MPLNVSDSRLWRENCILFTRSLQYVASPLYSLQLTTRSTYRDTRRTETTHTQMNANAHELSSRLKAAPRRLSFPTFLVWRVIKKCHWFWGECFPQLSASELEDGMRERQHGNGELLEDHACKLSLQWHMTFLWHEENRLFLLCWNQVL